ncbi:MAG: tetratricopeptide repeat protein [Anaerolineaceae bacterium]|nr:tetratricopeptide repeat protein [Anaerolineaceae bacterium]
MSQSAHVSLQLLGSFSAIVNGQAVPLRRKTRALVAYLATMEQPQTRRHLMALFCQEANAPSRALAVLLSRVRKQLGQSILLTSGEMVQLNFAAVSIDLTQFLTILEEKGPNPGVTQLATAVSLYRAEFLAGLTLDDTPEFEQWVLVQQARLRHLLERGLLQLIDRLMAQDQPATALPYAQQLVQQNPLLEVGHARLMVLYAQTGQREAALAQYEKCCAYLQAELAVAPTPELQTIHTQIKTGKIGRPGPITLPVLPDPVLAKTADFVGRDAEMSQLQAVWQATQAGSGQILLIQAEAGAGKSRLMQEFAAQLKPGQVLMGHCYESTMVLPFQPWQEVLAAHLAAWDEAALHALPLFVQLYLARLLPAQAERLGGGTAVSHPIQAGELGQLLTAVFDFLSRTPDGSHQPRLIFIDDLQWADDASLQLFSTIALRLAKQPILLVGALRQEEQENSPVLQTLLHDLSRKSTHQLQLSLFSAHTIEQLMVHLWSQLPQGYRRHIAQMMAQATGGNALFVTELLTELSQAELLPETLPVPPSVRELVNRRLQRMTLSGRQVLEALAVLNSPVTLPLAQPVSARSEEEAVAALEMGVRQGLLVCDEGKRPFTHQFRHDLVREAVLSQISGLRRELLHRRAARQLELMGATAAILAYHWGKAGEIDQETHYLVKAGLAATAVYAYEEAIHHFQHALPRLAQLPEKIDMLCRIGECHLKLGNATRAESVYQEAEAMVRMANNAELTARLAAALGHLYLANGNYPAAKNQFTRAIASSKNANHLGKIDVLDGLATLHLRQGGYDQAIGYAQEALHLARSQKNEREEARCLATVGLVLTFTGDYENAFTAFNEGIALAKAANNLAGLAKCYTNLSSMFYFKGELAESLRYTERAWQIDKQLGHQHGIARHLGNIGLVLIDMGEYEQAQSHIQQALAMEESLGNKEGVSRNIGNLALIYFRQEAFATAVPYIEQALALEKELQNQEGISRNYANLGIMHHHLGQFEQALQAYHDAWEIDILLENQTWLANMLMNMGLAYGRLGQFEMALNCFTQALSLNLEQGLMMYSARILGNLGRLFAWQDEWETAVACLEKAVRLGRQLELQADVCNDLHTLALLKFEQGHPDEALQLTIESAAIAQKVRRPTVVQVAQLLRWRCEAAIGLRTVADVLADLTALLATTDAPEEIAGIQFTICQIDPTREALRRETAVRYRTLYEKSPNIEYRKRYHSLTQQTLPLPDIVSRPPPLLNQPPPTIAQLLAQI